MSIRLDDKNLSNFIKLEDYEEIKSKLELAHNKLHSNDGEFLGWLTLPEDYDKEEFDRIKKASQKIRSNSDALVVIGIGGSYLGARASIEFLNSQGYNLLKKDAPDIYFAGNNMSSSALSEILELCEDKDLSINVISKSGTTTEPAIAFRIFKELLEKRYGKEGAKERIYCTTDKSSGTLKELADREGYETFVVPDNIGGRYSVLSAVGLLPIAVSGANIDEIMIGAKEAKESLMDLDLSKNDCYKYAAIRNLLYQNGKSIEILVSYEPNFNTFGEWWKQLFGESEGKDGKGIYPSSAIFSTDLHSLGQFIQEGTRNIFETVVLFDKVRKEITIPYDEENLDNLNFLANKKLSYVNEKAFEGTVMAHTDGGVPNIILRSSEINEHELGYMIYFFEKACAISGYILGVDPFNQPGVEKYKKNMFKLLEKPGY